MKTERTPKEISDNNNDSSTGVVINIWQHKVLNDKRKKGDQRPQRISSFLALNLDKSEDDHSEKSLPIKFSIPARKTNEDEENVFDFNPKFYTFRLGSSSSQDASYNKSFRPPNWLLFDHTIAIIWYLFSPNVENFKKLNIPLLEWTLEFVNSSKSADVPSPPMDLLVSRIQDKLIEIYANQSPKSFLKNKDNQITSSYIKKARSPIREENQRGPQPPPSIVRNRIIPDENVKVNSLENILKNYKQSKNDNHEDLSNKLDQLRERHVEKIAQELIKLHDIEEVMDQVLENQQFVRYSNKDSENLLHQMVNEIKK